METLKQRRYLFGVGLIVLVAAVFGFWKYLSKPFVQKQNENTIVSEGGEENSAVKKIPPPQGYESLHSNPTEVAKMSAEYKQKQMDLFDETVKILQEHPDSVIGWLNLGGVKRLFGDYRGAEQAWLHVTEMAPDYTPPLGSLGALYWQDLKEYKKAEVVFKKFIELDSTAVYIYRDLADMYRYNYTEKKDQFVPILLDGLAKNPEHPDILSYLAEYYYRAGDIPKAIDYYERLVKVLPGNEQAKEDLANLKEGKKIGTPR